MIALSHHSIGVASIILDRDKYHPFILNEVSNDALEMLEEFRKTRKKNKKGEERSKVLFVNGVDNLAILLEKDVFFQYPIVLFDSITNLVRVETDVVDAEQREDGTWLLSKLTPPNFNYMISETPIGYDGSISKAEKPPKSRKVSTVEALILPLLKDVPEEKQRLFRTMCFRIILGKNTSAIMNKKAKKWGVTFDEEALYNFKSFAESKRANRLQEAYMEVAGVKSPARIKKVAANHKVGVKSLAYIVAKYPFSG